VTRRIRVALAVSALAIVAYGAWLHWGPAPEGPLPAALDWLLYAGPFFVGAAACLARAALVPAGRLAWALIGLGAISYALADIYWSAFVVNLEPEPPASPADALWLASYAFLLAGAGALLAARTRSLADAAIDAGIATLTAAAVYAALVLPSVLSEEQSDPVLAMNVAYAVGAVALALAAVLVLDLNHFRLSPSLVLLAGGLLTIALADSLFTYQFFNAGYVEGTALDASWPAGMLALGAAAWAPEAPRSTSSRAWRRAVTPTAFGLASVVLLASGSTSPLPLAAIVCALAAVALVLARLVLLHDEASDLADRLRDASSRAERDPLTGLLNHRAFHDRLAVLRAEAVAAGAPLSLVIADLDDFKGVNDDFGHDVGDAVIFETSRRISAIARESDVIGRVGGDEFAWLLPGTPAAEAAFLADATRRAIAAGGASTIANVTVSFGVAELRGDQDARSFFALTDRALYAAKRGGRDQVQLESTEEETAASIRRGHSAVHALARAVDARDAVTNQHAERVASRAHDIALAAGWSPQRAALLRESALLHDVGKIGVPDSVLMKRGPLDAGERGLMERHAEIGASIVSGVLDPEQVAWVRHHHERWDGRGYPNGLAGDAIPVGARILAVADALEAMTEDRTYRPGRAMDEAIATLVAGRGSQWCPKAVDGLLRADAGAGSAHAADGSLRSDHARTAEAGDGPTRALPDDPGRVESTARARKTR
jgi:diguanylate cyclase (GGDEF)-like protein